MGLTCDIGDAELRVCLVEVGKVNHMVHVIVFQLVGQDLSEAH